MLSWSETGKSSENLGQKKMYVRELLKGELKWFVICVGLVPLGFGLFLIPPSFCDTQDEVLPSGKLA